MRYILTSASNNLFFITTPAVGLKDVINSQLTENRIFLWKKKLKTILVAKLQDWRSCTT